MSYMSFCNFNSKSDGRRYIYIFFFSLNYSSSLSTSESSAKTPLSDSFDCSSTPCEVSAIPSVLLGNTLRALLEKSIFFSATAKFSSLIRRDFQDASSGFGRLGKNPAGATIIAPDFSRTGLTKDCQKVRKGLPKLPCGSNKHSKESGSVIATRF